MTLIQPNDWNRLRGEFLKTGYLNYSNINNKIFRLDQDEKLAMELKKINTWDCPLERMNPTVFAMIFSLYDKIESVAGKESTNSQIESELQTIKSYMDEILEMKKEFDKIRELFLFEDKEKISADKELPSIEIYDLEEPAKENSPNAKIEKEFKTNINL